MASTLVQIVSQIFGAQIITRIAQTLGISQPSVQSLVTNAVPGVLATLAQLAATPDGARRIAEQIQNQDSNIFGNLVAAVAGQQSPQTFIATGNHMLSSLGIDPGAIASALSASANSNTSQASQILGLVTPAVFGALAQQDPQIWSTGEGIAQLFDRERAEILSTTPLQFVEPTSQQVAAAAQPASIGALPTETQTAPAPSARIAPDERPTAQANTNAGLPTWVKLLFPLIILSGLMWYFKPQTKQEPAPAPAPTSQAAPAPTAQTVAAELAAFAQRANVAVSKASAALANITSADVSDGTKAQLEAAVSDMSSTAETFAKLPEAARREIAAPMQAVLAGVREHMARIDAMPRTDAIRPTLAKLRGALDAIR